MSAEFVPYIYAVFTLPACLVWAAFQDAVRVARTSQSPEPRKRLRRAADALVLAGLAHPALAFAGLDLMRQVSMGDFAEEPGAAGGLSRARTGVFASFVVSFVSAAVLWVDA